MTEARAHNAFIYITEKCLLDCDYCFFKDKSKGRVISWDVFRDFYCWITQRPAGGPACFEFTGGEPLLEWNLLKKMILWVRKDSRRIRIGVQTNGILLDEDKREFFKKFRIAVEIGLDGRQDATMSHRKPLSARLYRMILKNIKDGLKEGLDISCTMTVTPDAAASLKRNFDHLKRQGFSDIDVTPAALCPWNGAEKRLFRREYAKLFSRPGRRNLFVQDDLASLPGPFLDLSLHPPGYVCCGDVFLCLPEPVKKRNSLVSFTKQGVELNRHAYSYFLRQYEKRFRALNGAAVYRDYVLFSFDIVKALNKGFSKGCDTIMELLTFQKYQHQNEAV
ncbi:MAG: radical SAM protein [Candidatus Omnitrophota bacterium]